MTYNVQERSTLNLLFRLNGGDYASAAGTACGVLSGLGLFITFQTMIAQNPDWGMSYVYFIFFGTLVMCIPFFRYILVSNSRIRAIPGCWKPPMFSTIALEFCRKNTSPRRKIWQASH